MIHIDEFVRQKLKEREEPERPGAWLAMRELLDREMPAVATGAAFNWQRLVGYVTGLLLLLCASVGGYTLYMQHADAPQGLALNGNNSNAVKRPGSGAAVNNKSDNAVPVGTTNGGAVAQNNDVVHPASSTVAASTGNTSNPAYPKPNLGTLHSALSVKNTSAETLSEPTNANRSGVSTGMTASYNSASKTTSASRIGNAGHTNAFSVYENSITTTSASNTSHGRRHNPVNTAAATSMPILAAIANLLKPATNAGSGPSVHPVPMPTVRLKHDTIQRIQIVYHRVYDATAESYRYRVDTLPLEALIVARAVAESPLKGENADVAKNDKRHHSLPRKHRDATTVATTSVTTKSNIGTPSLPSSKDNAIASSNPKMAAGSQLSESAAQQPNAAMTQQEDNNISSAALNAAANAKIGNHHFRLFDASKVAAIVEHVKSSLDKVQIYPGLTAGLNGSAFTSNSLGGFQAGLTALVALNDWWTVMTELKYFYRFNTGSTLRDDYRSISDSSVTEQVYNGVNMKRYTWKDDSLAHYFNYDVVRTFEMPIALRYNWGQFYAMGGVNLVYSLSIKSTEVTRSDNRVGSHTELRPFTHDDQPFDMNSAPLVRVSDFGGRFGTGYLLGGGYQFSPGIYVDLRVAQTFWDNAGTDGAKQVSKELLHSPSFQLSMGYKFNAKK